MRCLVIMHCYTILSQCYSIFTQYAFPLHTHCYIHFGTYSISSIHLCIHFWMRSISITNLFFHFLGPFLSLLHPILCKEKEHKLKQICTFLRLSNFQAINRRKILNCEKNKSRKKIVEKKSKESIFFIHKCTFWLNKIFYLIQ